MAQITKLSKKRLVEILNRRLGLKDPVYLLEKAGQRWVGDIISPSFKGRGDFARQTMIHDALEAELDVKVPTVIGMLLCYTPDEWNLGSDTALPPKKKKKAG
jgi:acid stress-induced BolA-like protein IbaG/YrbA